MATAHIRRQPQPVHYDVEDEDAFYSTRPNTSTRRYRSAPPIPRDTLDEPLIQEGKLLQRRASMKIASTQGLSDSPSTVSPHTEELPRPRRFSPLAVCFGMVVTIVLLLGLSSLLSWWQVYQDDIHYGRPRTFQMDAVVGHNDSEKNPTHFILLNLNRHVEVIEIPGGDASHTRIYTGPVLFGDGQDLTPVTGEIRDENGHKDLILHIQNQQILLVNDGTAFHPQ